MADTATTDTLTWQVRTFDSATHSPAEIAAIHLEIRHWQVIHQKNRFHNFLESQLDLNAIGSYYQTPGGNFFIAELPDNTIIGFVGIINAGKGRGIVKRLAVVPDYHRCGVGSELMAAAIAWSRDNELSELTLTTGTLEKARPLYEKCGFIEAARVIRNRDIIMAMDLAER